MDNKISSKEWNLLWFKGYLIAASMCVYGFGIIALLIHSAITQNHILLWVLVPLCISCPFIVKWLHPKLIEIFKKLKENM